MSENVRNLISRTMIRLRLRPRRPIDVTALTALWTAILAIILTIASRFPFLKSLLGLDNNLPDTVVLFAAIIVVLLHRFRKEVREDTTKILDRLQGADFRIFASSHEQVLYIASKINSANHSICDISWVDYWGAYRTSPEREAADRAFDDAVRSFAAHKPYREIFVFDSVPTFNREIRMKNLKARALNPNNNGYYCAYLPKSDLPRFQFIIIDDEVVLHSFDGESTDVRCSIHHAEFARLFRGYYTLLWRKAIKLKDDDGHKKKELDRFFDKLEAAAAGSKQG